MSKRGSLKFYLLLGILLFSSFGIASATILETTYSPDFQPMQDFTGVPLAPVLEYPAGDYCVLISYPSTYSCASTTSGADNHIEKYTGKWNGSSGSAPGPGLVNYFGNYGPGYVAQFPVGPRGTWPMVFGLIVENGVGDASALSCRIPKVHGDKFITDGATVSSSECDTGSYWAANDLLWGSFADFRGVAYPATWEEALPLAYYFKPNDLWKNAFGVKNGASLTSWRDAGCWGEHLEPRMHTYVNFGGTSSETRNIIKTTMHAGAVRMDDITTTFKLSYSNYLTTTRDVTCSAKITTVCLPDLSGRTATLNLKTSDGTIIAANTFSASALAGSVSVARNIDEEGYRCEIAINEYDYEAALIPPSAGPAFVNVIRASGEDERTGKKRIFSVGLTSVEGKDYSLLYLHPGDKFSCGIEGAEGIISDSVDSIDVYSIDQATGDEKRVLDVVPLALECSGSLTGNICKYTFSDDDVSNLEANLISAPSRVVICRVAKTEAGEVSLYESSPFLVFERNIKKKTTYNALPNPNTFTIPDAIEGSAPGSNWKKILESVSVSTWDIWNSNQTILNEEWCHKIHNVAEDYGTAEDKIKGKKCGYPLLIDSINHPSLIPAQKAFEESLPETIVGFKSDWASGENVNIATDTDLKNYWQESGIVIVVPISSSTAYPPDFKDYRKGIRAAQLGVLYNAPLLFVASDNADSWTSYLKDKSILVVGDLAILGDTLKNQIIEDNYLISSLTEDNARIKIENIIHSDGNGPIHTIITNPKDIDVSYNTVWSSYSEYPTYSAQSLITASLASAMDWKVFFIEPPPSLAINDKSTDVQIKRALEREHIAKLLDGYNVETGEKDLPKLEKNTKYVIVGSPSGISLEKQSKIEAKNDRFGLISTDLLLVKGYGNEAERLYGMYLSEISSYSNRIIFNLKKPCTVTNPSFKAPVDYLNNYIHDAQSGGLADLDLGTGIISALTGINTPWEIIESGLKGKNLKTAKDLEAFYAGNYPVKLTPSGFSEVDVDLISCAMDGPVKKRLYNSAGVPLDKLPDSEFSNPSEDTKLAFSFSEARKFNEVEKKVAVARYYNVMSRLRYGQLAALESIILTNKLLGNGVFDGLVIDSLNPFADELGTRDILIASAPLSFNFNNMRDKTLEIYPDVKGLEDSLTFDGLELLNMRWDGTYVTDPVKAEKAASLKRVIDRHKQKLDAYYGMYSWLMPGTTFRSMMDGADPAVAPIISAGNAMIGQLGEMRLNSIQYLADSTNAVKLFNDPSKKYDEVKAAIDDVLKKSPPAVRFIVAAKSADYSSGLNAKKVEANAFLAGTTELDTISQIKNGADSAVINFGFQVGLTLATAGLSSYAYGLASAASETKIFAALFVPSQAPIADVIFSSLFGVDVAFAAYNINDITKVCNDALNAWDAPIGLGNGAEFGNIGPVTVRDYEACYTTAIIQGALSVLPFVFTGLGEIRAYRALRLIEEERTLSNMMAREIEASVVFAKGPIKSNPKAAAGLSESILKKKGIFKYIKTEIHNPDGSINGYTYEFQKMTPAEFSTASEDAKAIQEALELLDGEISGGGGPLSIKVDLGDADEFGHFNYFTGEIVIGPEVFVNPKALPLLLPRVMNHELLHAQDWVLFSRGKIDGSIWVVTKTERGRWIFEDIGNPDVDAELRPIVEVSSDEARAYQADMLVLTEDLRRKAQSLSNNHPDIKSLRGALYDLEVSMDEFKAVMPRDRSLIRTSGKSLFAANLGNRDVAESGYQIVNGLVSSSKKDPSRLVPMLDTEQKPVVEFFNAQNFFSFYPDNVAGYPEKTRISFLAEKTKSDIKFLDVVIESGLYHMQMRVLKSNLPNPNLWDDLYAFKNLPVVYNPDLATMLSSHLDDFIKTLEGPVTKQLKALSAESSRICNFLRGPDFGIHDPPAAGLNLKILDAVNSMTELDVLLSRLGDLKPNKILQDRNVRKKLMEVSTKTQRIIDDVRVNLKAPVPLDDLNSLRKKFTVSRSPAVISAVEVKP